MLHTINRGKQKVENENQEEKADEGNEGEEKEQDERDMTAVVITCSEKLFMNSYDFQIDSSDKPNNEHWRSLASSVFLLHLPHLCFLYPIHYLTTKCILILLF